MAKTIVKVIPKIDSIEVRAQRSMKTLESLLSAIREMQDKIALLRQQPA